MSSKRTVHVLRMGHRFVRDDRVSSHVGLVARAFGAEHIYLVGAEPEVKRSIDAVTLRWGGEFAVELVDDWKAIIRAWRERGGLVVHLTMYGQELGEAMEKIDRLPGNILVIVGAEKVPRPVFEMSDFNAAVGSQPHSEVAALAVFLDRLFKGEELKRSFEAHKVRITPSERGKQLVTVDC